VAKDWAADKMEAKEPESNTDSMQPGPSTQTPCRPYGEPPLGNFRVICGNMCWRNSCQVKRARGSILLGAAMFVQLTKKGVKLGAFVSSA
jgi:hypothetical protein